MDFVPLTPVFPNQKKIIPAPNTEVDTCAVYLMLRKQRLRRKGSRWLLISSLRLIVYTFVADLHDVNGHLHERVLLWVAR